MTFTGVKVFSATMRETREALGDAVTAWIEAQGDAISIVDIVQRQSSDSSFHMVSITVFYRESGKPRIDHLVKIPDGNGANGARSPFKALTFKRP